MTVGHDKSAWAQDRQTDSPAVDSCQMGLETRKGKTLVLGAYMPRNGCSCPCANTGDPEAKTTHTAGISALLSCRLLLGWCNGLRLSATKPTGGVGHEKEHDNTGDKNPQALVLKEFHKFLFPSGKERPHTPL